MATAYLNTIATAVPDFDVHQKFIDYCPRLIPEKRDRVLFHRMASRARIDHRYSFLEPHSDSQHLDTEGFYDESGFPDTAKRMQWYERHAFTLARRALDQLELAGTTHILITSCTGFYAPGLDQQIVEHYGLPDDTERTMVGFMGCFAALNALKLARHIVRAEKDAQVLVLNLELCTLHLKSRGTLEEMLSFLIFADGCAAGLITSEPSGIELQGFNTTVIPDSGGLITWRIGNAGFDMHLSGQVPAAIARDLPDYLGTILGGLPRSDVVHWAVHPGGRSVLDGVRDGARLTEAQLGASREVLRRFGNMSSATIMFVLRDILNQDACPGPGCAMAFGPGLTVESMRFAL